MLLRGFHQVQVPQCRQQWQLAAATTRAPETALRHAANGVPEWSQLFSDREVAAALKQQNFSLRPNQKPSTVSGSIVPTAEGGSTRKDVLLYRDTDGWCPFCERVLLALEEKGISYDAMLINLRDKPAWYKRKIPTAAVRLRFRVLVWLPDSHDADEVVQVPAASIRGRDGSYTLVWESFDILKRLEQDFPDRPLLPAQPELREEALELAGRSGELDSVGYKFMAGGTLMAGGERGEADPQELQAAQETFLRFLDEVESLLGKHGGPLFMGDALTLADITWMSGLERLGANLPVLRHTSLKDPAQRPNLARWFAAMNERPAYAKCKTDDWTHNLIARKLFRIAGTADSVAEADKPAREEAALKIQRNRRAIVDDILKGSGILRGRCNLYGGTLGSVNGYSTEPSQPQRAAIEYSLRRVCLYLLTGQTGTRHEHIEAAALGSAALAFFHNRASSPRDMSAAAAEQLRAACLKILVSLY